MIDSSLYKKLFGLLILIGVVILMLIPLPLPEGIKSNNLINGEIEFCRIKLPKLTDYKGGNTLVDLKLRLNKDTLRLRIGKKKSLNIIRKACNENMHVKIEYTAQRLLLRPKIIYWIQSVEIPSLNLTLND